MPVAQWLLDLLACPACQTALSVTEDRSGLRCHACRRLYPIRDDIPIMLLSEAADVDAGEPS